MIFFQGFRVSATNLKHRAGLDVGAKRAQSQRTGSSNCAQLVITIFPTVLEPAIWRMGSRCVCVCVLGAVCLEASLLYIVVFINLRPANREAAVNPGSVKTRCESRGGSNLRTESHRRTHTHTHTEEDWRFLPVEMSVILQHFSHYVIALRRLFWKLVSEEGDALWTALVIHSHPKTPAALSCGIALRPRRRCPHHSPHTLWTPTPTALSRVVMSSGDASEQSRRVSVLSWDQVRRLDSILGESVPMRGRGDFPTLSVQPRQIVQVRARCPPDCL